MTAVWRRSRDIAILRALGMAPSQSRWAALTQATVFSVAGLLVGIPLGLAAGRTLWRVTAGIIPLYYQAPVARGTLLLIGPAVLACGLLLALIDLSVPEREHVGVGSVKLPAGTSPRHDTARHDHIVARFDPQFRVELELLELLEVLRNLSEDTLEHLLGTGECPCVGMFSASVSIHSTSRAIWARTCGTLPRPKASYIPAIVRPLSVVGLVLAMGPSR